MTVHSSHVMATSLKGNAFDHNRGKVTNVRTEGIHHGNRKRKLNEERVNELIESLKLVGLYQAIGVRYLTAAERVESGDDRGLTLIYGAHRLEAHKRLFTAAKETGDDLELGRWEYIPAVVYPETMSDEWAEVAEITENLLRYELSDSEKSVYTVELMGLYKELGLVQEAVKKQTVSRAESLDGHDVRNGVAISKLPTVTEKVTKDLGITDRQVRRHVDDVGKRSGKKISAEKTPGPELREAAAEARKNAPPSKAEVNVAFVEWIKRIVEPHDIPEFKRLLKDMTKAKVLEML